MSVAHQNKVNAFHRLHNLADESAINQARQFFAGPQTPEAENRVRGELARIVLEAGIPEQVVYGHFGLAGQRGADVLVEVRGDILRKIAGIRETDRSHSTLDLARVAGGTSLIGWARNMMKMTTRSKLRDIDNRLRQVTDMTSYLGPNEATAEYRREAVIESAASARLPEDVDDDARLQSRLAAGFDRLLSETRRRPDEFKHAAARALLEHFGIAGSPVVTVQLRRELSVLLQARPSLPHESLAAWVAALQGVEPADGMPDAALRFWDGFTLDEGTLLLERGPRVSALVMRGYVEGAARPTPTQRGAAVLSLGALLPEHAEHLAPQVVDAVVATHCSRLRTDGRLERASGLASWDDAAVELVVSEAARAAGMSAVVFEQTVLGLIG